MLQQPRLLCQRSYPRIPAFFQQQHRQQQQRRTFFLPQALSALTSYGKPLHFHANRTLNYAQPALFGIISDIASYPSFIPGLQDAQILAETKPRIAGGKPLPALASLTLGIGGMAGSWSLPQQLGQLTQLTQLVQRSTCFVSHVYCSPERGVVEAVAGEERASRVFDARETAEYEDGVDLERSAEGIRDMGPTLFKVCRTKWRLTDVGKDVTEVDLRIEIDWKDGFLAAATQAAAPTMAEHVIAAFEKRARDTLPRR